MRLRGRSRDVEAIFAFLQTSRPGIRRLAGADRRGRRLRSRQRHDRNGEPVSEPLPVPRWRYGEPYLALLDTLEAALPLAHPSELSQESLARRIFAMSEGLIGETVRIVTEAAVLALDDGAERITPRTLDALDYTAAVGAPTSAAAARIAVGPPMRDTPAPRSRCSRASRRLSPSAGRSRVVPAHDELLSSWLHRLAFAHGLSPRHFGEVGLASAPAHGRRGSTSPCRSSC